MTEEERQVQWKKDINELYCAIGEFIVKFELVCHAVQTCIIFLLDGAGLHNQSIARILLAGSTAEPLRTLFESLVAETQTLEDIEWKIVKNALNRFQELTQNRNEIVHSTWFIGWGNENTTNFLEASGSKFHKNKTGDAIKHLTRKVEDFATLTEEAEALAKIFERLNGCFTSKYQVKENFALSSNGQVSVPPGT